MNNSRSTVFGKSTASTRLSNSSTISKGRKDNFFVYLYKKIWAFTLALWGKTRRSLWVLSTGFILLILPFSFAYLTELQKEAAKIMGGKYFVMQPKIQECIDDVYCVIKLIPSIFFTYCSVIILILMDIHLLFCINFCQNRQQN